MPSRQRDALISVIKTARERRLHKEEMAFAYNHEVHKTMQGYSDGFVAQFGFLTATAADVLLVNTGSSLVDRRDTLGLPVQVVAFPLVRAALLLRVVGKHRLVGDPAYLVKLQQLFEPVLGPLDVSRWT